jgi:hypothetical protein
MTTSADLISSRARTVRRPGSPGPVPTNATEPTGLEAFDRGVADREARALAERAAGLVAGVWVAGVLAIVGFTLFL